MKVKKDLKNIFVDTILSEKDTIVLSKENSNRLKKVLRFKKGWIFCVFNAKDGLFLAEVLDSECQEVLVKEQLKKQPLKTNKVLFLPILKKDALSNAVRQATELGIDIIQPILTDFTVERSLKKERYEQIILNACEQSERLSIPILKDSLHLKEAINMFENKILWACERSSENSNNLALNNNSGVLVGPEGGFSEEEKEFLSKKEQVVSISLGEMILKADTAVVATLIKFNDFIK